METFGAGSLGVTLQLGDDLGSLWNSSALDGSSPLTGVLSDLEATSKRAGASARLSNTELPSTFATNLEFTDPSEDENSSPGSLAASNDLNFSTRPLALSSLSSTGADPLTGVEATALVGDGDIQVKTPNSGIVNNRIVFSSVNEEVRPAKKLTIRNTGDGPLQITGLSIGNSQQNNAVRSADNLRNEDFKLVNAPARPFTIAAGGSRKVSVQFAPERVASKDPNDSPTHTVNGESYAALTITSNDPDQPNVRVNLAGLNIPDYEANNEPSVAEIARTFGWTTNIGTEDNLLGGDKSLLGDEVYSPYWQRADTTKPVELWPLAVYSGRTNGPHDSIRFEARPGSGGESGLIYELAGRNNDDSSNGDEVLGSNNLSGGENQKLLPKILVNENGVFKNRTPTASRVDFTPTSAFGLNRGGASTDDTKNGTEQLHNWRIFAVKNAQGNVIPDTWLATVDPGNNPDPRTGKNFDYNDDVYLLVNAKPQASQRTALYRLDAGRNSSYTDTEGRIWTSDSGYFAPSDVQAETRGIGSNIQNTNADTLFRTYRGFMDFSTPLAERTFTYNLPVSEPQQVDLYLRFAEMYWGAPNGGPGGAGRRIFDVIVEGDTVLNNFDIFAASGGALRAVERAIQGVQVNDGTLNIKFKTEKDFAAIGAIAVLPS